ncbi:MAG: C_GCAxxG_C_C family protein [Kiritimatiellae bacterium]|nr:C_GCAxxG_C_C family protein [Kiritimatiellia bacterium]
MQSHAEKAVQLFEQGCSCSQAVFTAYAEDYGLDRKTAMKVSVALGGGGGRMRETCGAVAGMMLVAGLKYGNTEPGDAEAKSAALEAAQKLAERFKADQGSIICKELLGLAPLRGTTEFLPQKKPCKELVRKAAELLESL